MLGMKASEIDHLPLVAFIFSIFFVGFNAIGVRYTVLELSPFWGATLRFAPAALLLFLLAFFLKLPIPRGRGLLGSMIYGALNFGASYAFIYYGLGNVQPGMAQVILALVPLFTLIFAILHRQESFRWRAILGTLLAAGGIAIVFGEQLQANVPVLSLAALVFGAICISESSVIAKGFPSNHPITTNAIGMSIGAIILFGMSLIWREPQVLPVKTKTWIALAYLILLGSCIAFILFLYVLKYWTASTLSYQFVLMPFVTISASAWFVGEKLNSILLVGAVLVLLGVYFGVLYKPRKKAEKPLPITSAGDSETEICSTCP
jgi:drug/metabolite transporter (DMT)-like permease